MKSRVLIINQYFKTPEDKGVTRLYWIAKEFESRGHSVTVLSHKNLNQFKRERGSRVQKVSNDIHCKFIYTKYSNSMGLWGRLMSFSQFACWATYRVLFVEKYDIIYASSTPLTVAIPAIAANLLRRKKYILEVRDLWPSAPVELGELTNKYQIQVARFLEYHAYNRANKIVALSPGMLYGVLSRDKDFSEKTTVITNLAKTDVFYSEYEDFIEALEHRQVSSKVRIVYIGQFGKSNGYEYVQSLLRLSDGLTSQLEFHFWIHGKHKEDLENEFENRANVFIHDRIPFNALRKELVTFDLSLVTFSNYSILDTNSPNKLFDSLSAGIPVIVNSNGWTADMINNYSCGFHCSTPEELIEILDRIGHDKKELRQLSRNAFLTAKDVFDMNVQLPKLYNFIQEDV